MNYSILIKKLIPLISGSALVIILLELLFRALPVKQVHQFAENDISQPVLRSQGTSFVEPIDWKFSNAISRKINNYGFVDDRDYAPNSQPIAVIGDSYIQSAMLPYQDTLHGRLTKNFNSAIPVYSFGIPMYSLASYIGTAEYATKEFKPRAFVFLITKGDLTESLQPQKGSYFLDEPTEKLKFQPSEINSINTLFYRSSLVRYVYTQIKFDPKDIIKNSFNISRPQRQISQDKYREIADQLLNSLNQRTSVNQHNTIFIIDSDRDAIYNGNPYPDQTELLTFKAVAIQHGYRVLDTQDFFQADYQQHRKKLDFYPQTFTGMREGID